MGESTLEVLERNLIQRINKNDSMETSMNMKTVKTKKSEKKNYDWCLVLETNLMKW